MKISSAKEMQDYAYNFAKQLQAPAVIELIGDVGVGKSTFVQGLARGLGVVEPVTSPSFTLSKQYQGNSCRLVHYDFYRLSQPGIMSDDLAENLADPQTINVIEWGESIQDLLPRSRHRIQISYQADGGRELLHQVLWKCISIVQLINWFSY